MSSHAFGPSSVRSFPLTAIVLLVLVTASRAQPSMNWNLRHPTIPAHHLHHIIARDDSLFAIGDLGTIFKSQDGLRWTVAFQDSAERLNAAAFGGRKYIAVGNRGGVWTSDNGDSWIRQAPFTTTNIMDAAFGNGVFVALTEDNQLFSSPDGAAWTHREALAPTQFNHVRRIRFLNGRFFALHEQTLLTSTDAITWNRTSLALPDLHHIVDLSFGNGAYILGVTERFTSMKRIWTSSDGMEWTGDFDMAAPFALQTLFFGNGFFVALGEAGASGRSSDGINWDYHQDPRRFYLEAGLFWKGVFYAVGLPGLVARSTDALNWERVNSTLSQELSDISCAPIGCVAATERSSAFLQGCQGMEKDQRCHHRALLFFAESGLRGRGVRGRRSGRDHFQFPGW